MKSKSLDPKIEYRMPVLSKVELRNIEW